MTTILYFTQSVVDSTLVYFGLPVKGKCNAPTQYCEGDSGEFQPLCLIGPVHRNGDSHNTHGMCNVRSLRFFRRGGSPQSPMASLIPIPGALNSWFCGVVPPIPLHVARKFVSLCMRTLSLTLFLCLWVMPLLALFLLGKSGCEDG